MNYTITHQEQWVKSQNSKQTNNCIKQNDNRQQVSKVQVGGLYLSCLFLWNVKSQLKADRTTLLRTYKPKWRLKCKWMWNWAQAKVHGADAEAGMQPLAVGGGGLITSFCPMKASVDRCGMNHALIIKNLHIKKVTDSLVVIKVEIVIHTRVGWKS